MATLFYLLLVLFAPHTQFSWFWFFVSVICSLAEEGGRKIYRYTTDQSLAGYEEEV